MNQIELMDEIRKLPTKERLEVIEATIHTLQDEIQLDVRNEQKQKMARAAELLLKDYQNDDELTSFTTLDGETFHE